MSNHIISSAMYNAAEKVLDLYAQQQELREKLGISQRPCPRCGGKMREGELVLNALSRYSNAYICPDCGVEEAYTGKADFNNWFAMRYNKSHLTERQFAASGSCFAPVLNIYGEVNGITFTSEEFSGTMDSQKFWDDLAAYAASIHAFVRLLY